MSVPVATRLQDNMGRVYSAQSNGVLQQLLEAIGSVIDRAHQDGTDAIAQLNLLSSSAGWLDQWGDLYKVPRLVGESDVLYAPRIISQVIRPRSQWMAIEQIVEESFNLTIQIRDLYPFLLLSDQFYVPTGRPSQSCDAQLAAGFDNKCDYTYPYTPGNFGVWIEFSSPNTPYTFTIEDIRSNFPLDLFSDYFDSASMVCDGFVGNPSYGISFGPVSPSPPILAAE